MSVYGFFLQPVILVQFSGGISYNSNGYAVLPSYTTTAIPLSVQRVRKSSIKFLPEGTHYANYFEFFTDYPVRVDNTPNQLGDYIIYNNYVYKIFSSQPFQHFTYLPTRHVEGIVARDNRIVWDGTTLNIPYPEIDSVYGPLFDLIAMVNSCFTSPTLTTIWGFQQEIQPPFPYCMVNIDSIENLDNTNYVNIDINTSNLTTNSSKMLIVSFNFYAFDQVQCLTLMEQFKLNFPSFSFSSYVISWQGFMAEGNEMFQELYENRTIFHGVTRLRFGWIVQQTATSTQTINTAAFALNIPPISFPVPS